MIIFINFEFSSLSLFFFAGSPSRYRQHRELDPEPGQVDLRHQRPLRLGTLPPEVLQRDQANLRLHQKHNVSDGKMWTIIFFARNIAAVPFLTKLPRASLKSQLLKKHIVSDNNFSKILKRFYMFSYVFIWFEKFSAKFKFFFRHLKRFSFFQRFNLKIFFSNFFFAFFSKDCFLLFFYVFFVKKRSFYLYFLTDLLSITTWT